MTTRTNSSARGSATAREAGAGSRRRGSAQRRLWIGWVFTAPFGLAFLGFLVTPLIYAFWLSLHSSSILSGQHFTGLDNYVKVFTDPLFLQGAGLVIRFSLVLIPIQMLVSLLAALVLDSLTSRFAKFSRLVIFVPYAVPAVIGAIMWGFLYSSNFGPLRDVFSLFNASAPNLLGPSDIFGALVNIVTWQWAGYYMIIIYAALKSIDPTLYEVASLDGANKWQVAVYVKIPLVYSALVLILVFALIGTLQFFTEPQILRSVASGSIDAAYTPNIYSYTVAFSYGQFEYAAAISFALGFIVFIASFIFMMATHKKSGLFR